MFAKMTIRSRLIFGTFILVTVPMVFVMTITMIETRKMAHEAEKESRSLSYGELNLITKNIYHLIESHQEVILNELKSGLALAHDRAMQLGGIHLG